jgi:hypothetical protein
MPLLSYISQYNSIRIHSSYPNRSDSINFKVGRATAALILAFLPLFWTTPSNATQMTLEEAQEALVLAQQELSSASAALQLANSSVSAATTVRDEAQANYNSASADWEATKVTISGTSTTATHNVVQNGTFDDASAWSGITMYQPWMYNNYGAAVVINGTLKGSYSSGNFYLQQGVFASPTRNVAFSVDVLNNDNQRNDTAYDYYRIEFGIA